MVPRAPKSAPAGASWPHVRPIKKKWPMHPWPRYFCRPMHVCCRRRWSSSYHAVPVLISLSLEVKTRVRGGRPVPCLDRPRARTGKTHMTATMTRATLACNWHGAVGSAWPYVWVFVVHGARTGDRFVCSTARLHPWGVPAGSGTLA